MKMYLSPVEVPVMSLKPGQLIRDTRPKAMSGSTIEILKIDDKWTKSRVRLRLKGGFFFYEVLKSSSILVYGEA